MDKGNGEGLEVEHEFYNGYILAPGIQMPSHGIYDTNVYRDIGELLEGNSLYVAGSELEAKQWVDREVKLGRIATEKETYAKLRGPLGIKEVVEHGSLVIFTNIDTGETKQYYNLSPHDSPEAAKAAEFIRTYLQGSWAENIRFEIVPAGRIDEVGGQGPATGPAEEYKYYGYAHGFEGETLETDDFEYTPALASLRQWAIDIAKRVYGERGGYGPGLKMPVDNIVIVGPEGLSQRFTQWDLFEE